MGVVPERRTVPKLRPGIRSARHHPRRTTPRRRLSEELQVLISIVLGVVIGVGIVLILVAVWWDLFRR